jgi:multiple sugar transport system substrate-binding protein
MKKWLFGGAVIAAAVAAAVVAQGQPLIFLSTQFTPIEEAQRMRTSILKDFAGVDFLPQDPAPFADRVIAEMKAGKVNVGVIGGQHGDFPNLVNAGALDNLSDVLTKLANRKFPANYVNLGKLGTQNQQYIPWMQATYIMVANKEALKYLPQGVNVNNLTYLQLRNWGANIQRATGQRKLGFPAGPRGLMHRFFQGYLLPSYTASVVTKFRTAGAQTAWRDFREVWQYANPQSTSYDFMQEPLLSGEVWVAWDHVARLRDALTQKPNDFVTFPAPAGPRGVGYMPVVAGLAIPKGTPDRERSVALIEYLTRPDIQARTLRENGFFPVVGTALPADLPVGLKMMADAVAKYGTNKNVVPSLLPLGLGAKSGEFNKVFQDAFQLIILRNGDIKRSLDQLSGDLKRVINDVKAPCWAPDPVSSGACPVE